MDDGDGAYTLELQAKIIADNAIKYRGTAPCPSCGVLMNPVEAMMRAVCPPCHEKRMTQRVKRKMA
jgi:predicted RNA-binding Zn-ribbon protein involved in translation (DUF1610 family)